MPNLTYELCESDDVRILRIELLDGGSALAAQPEEVTLKLIRNGSVFTTREMELDEEEGEWTYQFEDEDFETDLPAGKHSAKLEAEFSDERTATFPTRGYITISVLSST